MTTQTSVIVVGDEPPPMGETDSPSTAPPTHPPKGKRSSRNRFRSLNDFVDGALKTLDRAAVAVWLLLWRDTKPNGMARSSQEDLARRAGCTSRSVRRALDALEGAGLLSVVRRGGLNRGMSVYRIH